MHMTSVSPIWPNEERHLWACLGVADAHRASKQRGALRNVVRRGRGLELERAQQGKRGDLHPATSTIHAVSVSISVAWMDLLVQREPVAKAGVRAVEERHTISPQTWDGQHGFRKVVPALRSEGCAT